MSKLKLSLKKTNVNRQELQSTLSQYTTIFSEEQSFIARFLALLEHANAYNRDHLPGHMTGSAWIINPERTKVLLTHHAKLNRWLQPGGHADGDENILRVAMKEAEEETGLVNLKLVHPDFFDIDIHVIPARKNFPQHDHYDVRFLFQGNEDDKFLISEESHDLAWIPVTELETTTGANDSMTRMARKVATLK